MVLLDNNIFYNTDWIWFSCCPPRWPLWGHSEYLKSNFWDSLRHKIHWTFMNVFLIRLSPKLMENYTCEKLIFFSAQAFSTTTTAPTTSSFLGLIVGLPVGIVVLLALLVVLLVIVIRRMMMNVFDVYGFSRSRDPLPSKITCCTRTSKEYV